MGRWHRIPVALTLDAVYGTGLVELGGLQLTELDITATATALEVSLPAAAGALRVRVDIKAGSVELRIPSVAAVSIACEPSMSGSVELDAARFPVVVADRLYRSQDFETGAVRIEIEAHTSAGSIVVR